MTYLLDTHLLLWLAVRPDLLPTQATKLLADLEKALYFSVVSIWETAIKTQAQKDRPRPKDLQINANHLRRNLLANGYTELTITGEHSLAVAGLPQIHKDPFDRMLLAQAEVEGFTLVTADSTVAKYHEPPLRRILKV